MNKVIRLTESDLYDIVGKVLKINNSKNNTFIEKFDNLLEFHKKLYKGLYFVNGDHSELERQKRHYLRNLFPDNHKVIKECRLKFPNSNLLNENFDENYVDDFFKFIRENYIRQQRNIIKEDNNQGQQRKISPQITQYAKGITKELMAALGADADDDEEMAVRAIKKINSKECLYEVDRMVKGYKRGNAPYSLKDVINSYMSDYNSAQYRAIWQHLGKFGVTGANYNSFLAGVGKTVEAIGKGWDWLKKNGLDKLMNTFREFLDSGWGQAAQLFLDSFGVGAILNVVIWGLMAIWDLLNNNWGLLLLSSLSILTAGAMAPILGKFAKNFKSIVGGFDKVMDYFKNSAIFKGIKAWIPKIGQGINAVGKYVSQGAEWLLSKFGKYIPANWVTAIKSGVTKATQWVQSIGQKIMGFASEGAGENVVTKNLMRQGTKGEWPMLSKLMQNPKWANTLKGLDAATSKIVDDYVTANIRKYSWGQIESSVCTHMNQMACKAVKTIGISYEMKREGGEALGKGKDSIKNMKNVNQLNRKRDKAKELYQATGNLKTAIQKGQTVYDKEQELVGNNKNEA